MVSSFKEEFKTQNSKGSKQMCSFLPNFFSEISSHMFNPSLCRYSTRSQVILDLPLRKTNTEHKSLSLFGHKKWSKIVPSIKNVRTSLFFMHALKKYFASSAKLIHIITPYIWLILSFDDLIATLFFLVIIGIFLSKSSHFNFVFPIIFTYPSSENPNGNKHLQKLL